MNGNWYLAAFLLAASTLPAQTSQNGNQVEIMLERYQKPNWVPVDPGFVLSQGDRVRFQVKTNFAGFLYVMNQSTSGEYVLLFPREDTGVENRIEAHQLYTVPATNGYFRITGPPGQDVTYWVVSPVKLGETPQPYRPLPPPPQRKPGDLPPNLRPRCDETLLRARGDCIDRSAGVRPVESAADLPPNLQQLSGLRSRELVYMRRDERKTSVVASPEPFQGPVVYEFRLAHQ